MEVPMDPNEMLEVVKAYHQRYVERAPAAHEDLISHADLPELSPSHELHDEWNTYRRVVSAFLERGVEGSWLLIKADKVLGFYGRWEHAYIAALESAVLNELRPPFLIQKIL